MNSDSNDTAPANRIVAARTGRMHGRRHQHHGVDVARGRQCRISSCLKFVATCDVCVSTSAARPTTLTVSDDGGRAHRARRAAAFASARARRVFVTALEPAQLERDRVRARRQQRQHEVAVLGRHHRANALQVRRSWRSRSRPAGPDPGNPRRAPKSCRWWFAPTRRPRRRRARPPTAATFSQNLIHILRESLKSRCETGTFIAQTVSINVEFDKVHFCAPKAPSDRTNNPIASIIGLESYGYLLNWLSAAL